MSLRARTRVVYIFTFNCCEVAEVPRPERESSNVMEGREGVKEGELEDREGVREEVLREGELEESREEAVTEWGENAEPSGEDCCWVLRLLLLPFRCISSIKRLTSFSDNCWPELV